MQGFGFNVSKLYEKDYSVKILRLKKQMALIPIR